MRIRCKTAAGLLYLCSVLALGACCGEQDQTIDLLDEKVDELSSDNEKLAVELEVKEQEVQEVKGKLVEQAEVMEEMEMREQQAKARLDTLKGMVQRFKGMIETGQLTVKVQDGKMVLELPSQVLFESGSAEISENGQETLREVARVLKTIKGREFQVAGHTDNKHISKENPFETNWHLSAARAVAVVIFLKQEGVRPKQLSAAGYGPFRPVASNKTKKGQAKNRRIEIILMPNLEELPDLTDLEQELGAGAQEGDSQPVEEAEAD